MRGSGSRMIRRGDCVAAVAGLCFGVPQSAAATTFTVCPGTTYPTIEGAVQAAVEGDTISVCAGVYDEVVTVDKPLTLLGAQAGNDARDGRSGAVETVIDGTAAPAGLVVT